MPQGPRNAACVWVNLSSVDNISYEIIAITTLCRPTKFELPKFVRSNIYKKGVHASL